MSRLSLYLLGPPRLELNGEPLEIGRRKAMALLAYLAVTGQAHSRDTLATLLWPDYDQSRARAALRRTLSTLNRALGGVWLEASRESIGLVESPNFWLDVSAFRAGLAASTAHGHPKSQVCPECVTLLVEAVALYQDDFLAGFTLRDSPEFDDWQFFQAEELRRELAGALERLVQAYCDQGDYETGLGYARRWLRLDPLHEETHRRLMQLYAWSDQRPAALRQYQECVRILEEELGVPPAAETTALYERIRAGAGEGGPAVPADGRAERDKRAVETSPLSPPPFLTATPQPEQPPAPFVGREAELDYLRGRLEAALAGAGHVALVAGEAGSGKTALAHEFARRAQGEAPDLLAAFGACDAHTGPGDPYLPFREILALLTGDVETRWAQGTITEENALRLWAALPHTFRALSEVGPDLVDSLLPASGLKARAAGLGAKGAEWIDRLERLGERRRAGDGAALRAQSDLFEQVTQLLVTLSRECPLLLVMDDAQWADMASIGLLFHLSRRLAGSRILLMVTYRPDDVALGRGGERHPLEPVINELRRTFGEVWIELDPAMGRPFVDALLDSQPNRLGEGFRAALTHQTGGHPLFTVELLRAMQERGDLVRDPKERWIEGTALNWKTLPARVEAVVAERVGRLEPGLRDLLSVASVEGEIFTAQVVARVQGLGERPLLQSLSQDLERRHQLVQAQGEVRVDHQFLSRYRFTHTVFQQYLYNTFSPGERRLLHGTIAGILRELYREEGEESITVQLARHYAQSGQVDQAVDYLLRAGDRARDLHAHQEAIDHYQQALAFLKEVGNYERAARTLMKLGLAHHLAFDFPRAREAYQEGFALWQRAGAALPPPQPPAPHPLRVIWSDPITLDPTLVEDETSGAVVRQLFSGLVSLNAELDVVPELAQSWEVLEGGEQYRFHLRSDARWSDGSPVTAHDYVYAWRRVLDPGVGSPNAEYLFDIKGAQAFHQGQGQDPDQVGVRALDATTLLVELEAPTSYFPHLLTQQPALPVPRHVLDRLGSAWTEIGNLVTNGPFTLEDWQPGRSMRLARNPMYRGQFSGNVEQVILTLNADKEPDHLDLYQADELDIVPVWPSPKGDKMRRQYAAEYFSGPSLFTQYIGFNVRRPPFDDLRVRQAFAIAADKETLASVRLSGYYFPASGGFIPPGMPGHSPGIGLPYDPARARALLAQAGYPGGKDFPAAQGLGSHGKDVVFPLIDQWRENLGVEVTWEFCEWGEFFDRMDHDRPNLFRIGWNADYPDPDNLLRMGSYRHWVGWRNETYSRLLEQARSLTNQAERMALYQQADRILVEEVAVLPVLYGRHHLLVKPWIRKFSPSAMSWTLWKDVVIEAHG